MVSEIDIDRSAEAVWAVLADYDRDTEWRGGVTTMRAEPPGPATTGTRTVEVMRFAGRTLHNDGLVTDAGPGLRFSWRTTSGVSADGLREVTATGAGAAGCASSSGCARPGSTGSWPGPCSGSCSAASTPTCAGWPRSCAAPRDE